jgi:lipoate-protein ligase A
VYGERKFGGNAQAITGRRWLHHTSFLWDYTPGRMAALAQPAKQPAYRQVRGWCG